MKLPRPHWPEIAAPRSDTPQTLGKRLLWMAAIWLASTAALLLVAWVLRAVLRV